MKIKRKPSHPEPTEDQNRINELYASLKNALIKLSGKSQHYSDCRVNNGPAIIPEECNCTRQSKGQSKFTD